MSIAALIEAVEAGNAWRTLDHIDAAGDDHRERVVQAFNSSLDAAKALHDAQLPGVKWVLFQCDDGSFGCNIGDLDTAFSTDPARAWLLAILRAKEAGQ